MSSSLAPALRPRQLGRNLACHIHDLATFLCPARNTLQCDSQPVELEIVEVSARVLLLAPVLQGGALRKNVQDLTPDAKQSARMAHDYVHGYTE
jgi:hypothetical protein